MAITVTTTLAEEYFSASIPDIDFSITGDAAVVTFTGNSGEVILETTLYPVAGHIRLRDLSGLVDEYAKAALVLHLSISIQEMVGQSASGSPTVLSTDVVFCRADISEDAATFCSGRFLSLLMGTKITALGRLEYLHFVGSGIAAVTAHYSDGTTGSFTPTVTQGNDDYKTIDVSASNFLTTGKTLTYYVVTVGSRTQRYNIDFAAPDAAPILLFTNSFGVQELLYCTGEHEVKPEYTRSSAYMDGMMRNYRIEEVRKFEADTGVMNTAMANWADELFRSDEIYICNFYNNTINVGKEITIIDSKSERSNLLNAIDRFTFSYRYSQRNNNVLQLQRAGRIFDNTFDNTFN